MHTITFTWVHWAGSGKYTGRYTVTVLDPAQARQRAKQEIEERMGFLKDTVKLWEVTQ